MIVNQVESEHAKITHVFDANAYRNLLYKSGIHIFESYVEAKTNFQEPDLDDVYLDIPDQVCLYIFFLREMKFRVQF